MHDEATSEKRTHEQFVIDSRGAPKLRQDRFEPPAWSCHLVVGGRELAVCNYSAFGLAVVAIAEHARVMAQGEGVPAPFKQKVYEVSTRRARGAGAARRRVGRARAVGQRR